MAIDTAKFIVQRGDERFSCRGDELRDKLQNGDLIAVQHDYEDEASKYEIKKDSIRYKTGNVLDAFPYSSAWRDSIYDGSKFWAICDFGSHRIGYSDDGGKTWIPVVAPEYGWQSIAYGDGIYVCVGANGPRIMYSYDGIDWKTDVNCPQSYYRCVEYGNGKFVATATDGSQRAAWSEDGKNWTPYSLPSDGEYTVLAPMNDEFVVGCVNKNRLYVINSSNDIEDLTHILPEFWHSSRLCDFAWSGSKGHIFRGDLERGWFETRTSDIRDGFTFVDLSFRDCQVRSVEGYDGGKVVVIGTSGKLAYTMNDGADWSRTNAVQGHVSNTSCSTDGTNWVLLNSGGPARIYHSTDFPNFVYSTHQVCVPWDNTLYDVNTGATVSKTLEQVALNGKTASYNGYDDNSTTITRNTTDPNNWVYTKFTGKIDDTKDGPVVKGKPLVFDDPDTFIDVSDISETDWLCCTDDDGKTYKVRGSNFKQLFVEPCWIGKWDRVVWGYRLFEKGVDWKLDLLMARYGVVNSTPKPIPCQVPNNYGGHDVATLNFYIYEETFEGETTEFFRVATHIDDYQSGSTPENREPWHIGVGCPPPGVSDPFTHPNMVLVSDEASITSNNQFAARHGTINGNEATYFYYPIALMGDYAWYDSHWHAPVYIDNVEYPYERKEVSASGRTFKLYVLGTWPIPALGTTHTFTNIKP